LAKIFYLNRNIDPRNDSAKKLKNVWQIGSIFVSLELRSVIEQEKVTAANVNADLVR
jgi:hypothetical protein